MNWSLIGWSQWAFIAAACAMVAASARALPLPSARRWGIVACRVAAVILVGLAFGSTTRESVERRPQRVLYLVDGSASMDARKSEWAAKRIASLEELRPDSVRRAVAVFGGDTRMVVPFGTDQLDDPQNLSSALARSPVSRASTDIESALLSSLGTLSREGGGRVVLLSDGWQTAGQAADVLGALPRFNVRVFSEPAPDATRAAKIEWGALSVPPVVQRGSPVAVRMVLFNGTGRKQMVEIAILIKDIPISTTRRTLEPGWQVVTASAPAIQQGTLAFDVRVKVPRAFEERRSAYTEVEGPPHILFVDDNATAVPMLGQALERREIEISLARSVDLPDDPQALLRYDAVFLFNIPKSAVSESQAAALRTYLERFGGGLVMVGLGGVLADEIQQTTPLDELLPITYEAKGVNEAKRRVCMLMLIDRSASMLGPRLAATKRAAVELVNQLADEDLVGVLAFDTKPYIIAEVSYVADARRRIVEKLVQLHSSGGTDVFPALLMAKDRLDKTGATVKHIILLSDGNTSFNAAAYNELVDNFRKNGTSISTIGIGSVFINEDYLTWLATMTGGKFYPLNSLDDLPRIIARDTQDALGRLPFTEGYFKPSRAPSAEWFADVPAWPVLRGYLTATEKPEARVEVQVESSEKQHPLLARWSVGLGRVAAFTSDADTRWSPEWISWPGFEGWWAQVARWAMRPRVSEELFAWVDRSRGAPRLVIEGDLRDPRAELVAPDAGGAVPLSLVQVRAWRWEAPVETVPSGWHELTVESAGADGVSQFARRWVQIGPITSAVDESPSRPTQESVLRYIAEETGGLYGAADAAFLPPSVETKVHRPASFAWLPLVILLVLVEVALRAQTQF